jgi:hypothetical protein
MSVNVSSLFELVMVYGFCAEACEGYLIVLVFNSRECPLAFAVDWVVD